MLGDACSGREREPLDDDVARGLGIAPAGNAEATSPRSHGRRLSWDRTAQLAEQHATSAGSFRHLHRLSEEIGLTMCMERSGKAIASINNATAMTTDRQLVKAWLLPRSRTVSARRHPPRLRPGARFSDKCT